MEAGIRGERSRYFAPSEARRYSSLAWLFFLFGFGFLFGTCLLAFDSGERRRRRSEQAILLFFVCSVFLLCFFHGSDVFVFRFRFGLWFGLLLFWLGLTWFG